MTAINTKNDVALSTVSCMTLVPRMNDEHFLVHWGGVGESFDRNDIASQTCVHVSCM